MKIRFSNHLGYAEKMKHSQQDNGAKPPTAIAWVIKLLGFVLFCDRNSLTHSSVIRNQAFVVSAVLISLSTKTTASQRSCQQVAFGCINKR